MSLLLLLDELLITVRLSLSKSIFKSTAADLRFDKLSVTWF